MLQNIHCISLRVVKHNDNTSIVTTWSRERGRMVFAVPSGSGREAQRRRAVMMPLSIFEGVANIKPGHDISKISDVKPYLAGNPTGSDPIKNIISLFLADFLYVVLRESQPDENLTDYIFKSIEYLKNAKKDATANFHIYFIYRLGQFLGISPDIGTYSKGSYFDLREGVFTVTTPLHRAFLTADKSEMVYKMSKLTPANLGYLKLNRNLRNEILDGILDYYTMHHTPVSQLPSINILRSIFS